MKQKTIEQILANFYHHINMNFDKEYQNKHKNTTKK